MLTKTTSTREQILNLLKIKNQLTVATIAEELNITEMAVRRHLNTLERDGIVETTLQRQAMGRPTNVYQLSHEGQEMFPRDYGNFTIEILKNIEELDGQEKINELFEMRRKKLKEKYEKRMTSQSFEERVYELANIHNEEGFMTEIEKREDGSFVFKEYNCPIAEVARHFPSVCYSELNLFKEVLQTEHVECKHCLATGQDNHCYYIIKDMEE